MESSNDDSSSSNSSPKSKKVGILVNIKDSFQKLSITLFKYSIVYPLLTLRKGLSALLSGIGFGWNFFKDIVKAGNHHLEWKAALGRLQTYLEDSGIRLEMDLAMNERFITNISVYDDVQRELKQNRQKETKIDPATATTKQPSLQQAAHFMRFATSAYGSEMIASSILECNDPNDYQLMEQQQQNDDNDNDEARILAYTSTHKDDVVIMDVEPGGSMEYLRHFCVVDHNQKALVLAVRGTFSLSGLVTDLVGFCEPFCGGQAHCGMAEMAKATWDKAQHAVLAKLQTLPQDYDLVITGHSLGAGVACLLTVLLYHQNAITTGHKVRCLAYAPPPVFSPLHAAADAVNATVAYIHNHDVVPFLSVHNVRKFFEMVLALDEKTKHMSMYEKILIDWDFRKPTTEMIEALRTAQTKPMKQLRGADQVGIPAKAIIWLREATEGETAAVKARNTNSQDDNAPKSFQQLDSEITRVNYIACVCDSRKVMNLSILINTFMITDHLTSKYENALRHALMEDDLMNTTGTITQNPIQKKKDD